MLVVIQSQRRVCIATCDDKVQDKVDASLVELNESLSALKEQFAQSTTTQDNNNDSDSSVLRKVSEKRVICFQPRNTRKKEAIRFPRLGRLQ